VLLHTPTTSTPGMALPTAILQSVGEPGADP
jgi:hypothetical protein